MEWFTIELVPDVSAKLFPEKTLRPFVKFLPEQPNPRPNGMLEFWNKPTDHGTKMLQCGSSSFLRKTSK